MFQIEKTVLNFRNHLKSFSAVIDRIILGSKLYEIKQALPEYNLFKVQKPGSRFGTNQRFAIVRLPLNGLFFYKEQIKMFQENLKTYLKG